ncbi:hypothetical protein SPRG_09792 [Saprolegnia parasitica CBS 223.65]|uniref:Uncharacterized protein n=1 Tax=Saprolegnia parasitica (strain CBS 223.65) TaxID=695850 RepID=A0A067C1J7_SAPPC|nr:hypothetical protein SPRG_09792 [Saprolegnia parasitica CBS 223.65]KDO24403.1 hypothetical protein SPRG_09792 [Saprolegnia parasitica CBS 223.65]|eukprot:XP_012204833.1 hypothetical protein SPRG_09792 [Saprolegnia parasitica CBS 223.65]
MAVHYTTLTLRDAAAHLISTDVVSGQRHLHMDRLRTLALQAINGAWKQTANNYRLLESTDVKVLLAVFWLALLHHGAVPHAPASFDCPISLMNPSLGDADLTLVDAMSFEKFNVYESSDDLHSTPHVRATFRAPANVPGTYDVHFDVACDVGNRFRSTAMDYIVANTELMWSKESVPPTHSRLFGASAFDAALCGPAGDTKLSVLFDYILHAMPPHPTFPSAEAAAPTSWLPVHRLAPTHAVLLQQYRDVTRTMNAARELPRARRMEAFAAKLNGVLGVYRTLLAELLVLAQDKEGNGRGEGRKLAEDKDEGVDL